MTLPPPLPSLQPPLIPVPAKKIQKASIWQLVLGIFSLGSYLLFALLLIVAIAGNKMGHSSSSFNEGITLTTCIAIVFFAVLCLPSIYLAIRRILGHESRLFALPGWTLVVAGGLLLLWGGLILFGIHLHTEIWSPFQTGLANIVMISLPILAAVIIGGHGLKIHSTQRGWGVFNLSQFFTTSLAMVIEIAVLVIALVAAGAWLSQQIDLKPYLSILQNKGTLTDQDIYALLSDIAPLIKTPVLYALAILGISLVVPMIEEFLKPLAVWFFAGKEITPSEGFFLGLLCGAAFALSESLLIMGAANGQWTTTVIGRAGTSLMHITTPAIIGWAMAKSWYDGRYFRISFAYLAMIVLHGTWNFFAVLMGLNNATLPMGSSLIESMMPIAKWVLCGLAALMITLLLLINNRLQKEAKPPVLTSTISQLQPNI